jgi:hypothetical protein
MCRHKAEYFKQAFISSAGVERGSTGNVCLKSPARNINAFPKLSATSVGRPSTTFFFLHTAPSICLERHYMLFVDNQRHLLAVKAYKHVFTYIYIIGI